jgi:PadR family transcriptional regulator, regulatory protein PadR
MCENAREIREGCRCRGGKLRGLIQPRLLLLLAQKPAHGYELMEVISQEDEPTTDPGNLYRILRAMEQDGLVISDWDTSGGGPARRIYQIADQGLDHLHAWIVHIRKTRQWLDSLLAEYEAHFSGKRNTEPESSR